MKFTRLLRHCSASSGPLLDGVSDPYIDSRLAMLLDGAKRFFSLFFRLSPWLESSVESSVYESAKTRLICRESNWSRRRGAARGS